MMDRDADGEWIIRPGGLAEALMRFWLAEQSFPTGLDIEAIGMDGEFLLLSQPFLVGENPGEEQLSGWMIEQGWEQIVPQTQLEMIAAQTWKSGLTIVTDVRSENAILAEVDGQIYPFDFIAGWEG